MLSIVLSLLVLVPHSDSQAPVKLPRRLTLPQAESLLVERNLSVLAAKYQVEANRAALLIASYRPNPVLTIGAEQMPFYSPLRGSFPRFIRTNPDAGANPVYTLRVDQIWERGGKRELRTALADAQLKASEAQMLDAIRTQVHQLREAFAAAALARENRALAETAAQQYGQTERLTQAKVSQGDIAGVEVYRVKAGRLQYEQSVLQQRTAYDRAVRDVLNLLGAREQDLEPSLVVSADTQVITAPLAPLELVSAFEDRPVIQNLDELRTIALAERPDVIAAREVLSAAGAGTRLAAAARMRDVSTGYEYQRAGSDHSAGIVVQVPLFLHNDQRALLTQAEAQQRSAEASLKQAELQAVTEVDKAYQTYLSTRRVLDLYNTENLSQVEKLRTVAALSYREGASSLFELLDAQRAYNQAMTAYNQARADYQLAVWQVEEAIGRSLY